MPRISIQTEKNNSSLVTRKGLIFSVKDKQSLERVINICNYSRILLYESCEKSIADSLPLMRYLREVESRLREFKKEIDIDLITFDINTQTRFTEGNNK